MKRIRRFDNSHARRTILSGVLCCVLVLTGLSCVSPAERNTGISDLADFSLDLDTQLEVPEDIKVARVAAFKPLPRTKGIGQRRDEVVKRATMGMKPGGATAGALLEAKRRPALQPLVKPELPLFDERRKPDFAALEFGTPKCKPCKSKRKCRCRCK